MRTWHRPGWYAPSSVTARSPARPCAPGSQNPFVARRRLEKHRLDLAPAHAVIAVTGGKFQQTVNMLRQNHNRLNRQWVSLKHLPKSGAEGADVFRQRRLTAIREIHRKEISAPRGADTADSPSSWQAFLPSQCDGFRFALPILRLIDTPHTQGRGWSKP